jgi:IMP dehydrogenase/GMP reductase
MLYEVYRFADALKVGIGSGAACTTKNTAGCYEPQFSAVLKFKEEARRLGMPVISDGGIREPADFVKAVGAGAGAVMAGSIFARCPESAAEVVEGKKIYAGMASRYVQDRWKGGLKKGTCPEGKVVPLDLGEPVGRLLERYVGALRSGITYAGATDVKSFQELVEFVTV